MIARNLAYVAGHVSVVCPSSVCRQYRPSWVATSSWLWQRFHCCARCSGLRQVSAELEKRCGALGWHLEHLGVTIGTVIHGPNLSEHRSDEEIAAMYAVLLERKVIFFRDQDLSPEMQRGFGVPQWIVSPLPYLCVRDQHHSGVLGRSTLWVSRGLSFRGAPRRMCG